MSTRSPGAAVLEALAVYLADALTALSPTVIRGWPETDQGLDLETGPQIAVTQTGRAEEIAASTSILGDVVAGSVNVRTGYLSVPLQVDVWARSREALDAACTALDDALHNDLPYRPHLYLTADDHHDRPFVVMRDGDAPDIDGDTAPTGEWRAIYTLRAEIERVVGVTMPESVSVSATIDL